MTTPTTGPVPDPVPGPTTTGSQKSVASILLALAGVGGFVVSLGELWRGGIGWDTKFHADAALITRATPSGSTLQEAYDRIPLTDQFYGVLIHQLADKAHALFGGTSKPLSTLNKSTYVWQGAVVAVLAWVSLCVLSFAIARIRGARSGLTTWALVGTLPLWVGMSHLDFLDIGVASGVTMLSAAFLLCWNESCSRVDVLIASVFALFGSGVSLAIRPGSSVVLVVLLVVNTAVLVAFRSGSRRGSLVMAGIVTTSAVVGGLGLVYLSHPLARIDLFTWLRDCYTIARDFPWVGPVRTGGHLMMSNELPWWYVPGWLVAQTPVLVLLIALICCVFAIARVVRGPSVDESSTDSTRPVLTRSTRIRSVVPVAPLIVQGVLLPGAIVGSGAVLYDGIRHVLFMVPALFALVAIAVSGVSVPKLRTVGIALAVLSNLFALVQWFPYSYAHINHVAALAQPADWELDFWGVSAREGIERLQKEGFASPQVAPTVSVAEPYGGVALGTDPAGKPFGIYMFVRNNTFPPGCEQLFTVRRAGQTLGIGGRCNAPLNPTALRGATDFGTESVGDRDQ